MSPRRRLALNNQFCSNPDCPYPNKLIPGMDKYSDFPGTEYWDATDWNDESNHHRGQRGGPRYHLECLPDG